MFNSFKPEIPFKNQLQEYPDVLNNLDIPFVSPQKARFIGARNIFSHPQLRITIFHIPQNKTMKLHNHPHMHVLTYILQGSMLAKIFNQHPKKSDLYLKTEKILSKGMQSTLDPNINNFH